MIFTKTVFLFLLFPLIFISGFIPGDITTNSNSFRINNNKRSLTFLKNQNNNDDNFSSITRRFTNPVLDDPILPLRDVLMAQITAPTLQVFFVTLTHAPSPSWLQPISNSRGLLWQPQGSLVAPTLIHGAALAGCWLLGALAAKAYEKEAIDPTIDGYGAVIFGLIKAGTFAVGIFILCTQLDLLQEFGRWPLPGESEVTDVRLCTAWIEGARDVIFEAGTISSMRLYLALSIARRVKM